MTEFIIINLQERYVYMKIINVVPLIVIIFVTSLVSSTNIKDNIKKENNPVLQKADNSVEITRESETTQNNQVIELYSQFLNGDVSVDGIDIDYLSIPTGEPHERRGVGYAFFDSNGDLIPELHVNSGRYYYIFIVKDKDLAVWKTLSPNPPCYALNNGAFLYRKYGAGPKYDLYYYVVYDYMGNEVYELNFSKYDKNKNGLYDEDDEYLFDGVNVTKEIWEGLTERYLFTDSSATLDP